MITSDPLNAPSLNARRDPRVVGDGELPLGSAKPALRE